MDFESISDCFSFKRFRVPMLLSFGLFKIMSIIRYNDGLLLGVCYNEHAINVISIENVSAAERSRLKWK